MRLTREEVMVYEIHSHWFASLIWFKWGHKLIARYFVWKVIRKHRRYTLSMDIFDKINKLKNKQL